MKIKRPKGKSLAEVNPKLAKQLHPTKNGDLTPFHLSEGSNKKVCWKCDKGSDHEWIANVSSRNNGNGCPFCTLTPQSRQELIITFELKRFFDINPKGFKNKVNNTIKSIYMLYLGIEFDGNYWHKGKIELDKLKTEQLIKEGFNIIRVRQEPLNRIFDNDVIASKSFDGKIVTNDILKQILKNYSLDKKTISKIEDYCKLEFLQNEKALDEYIEIILKEKSRKNKTK